MSEDTEGSMKQSFRKGDVFEGKYRVIKLIGTGNFSHVYLAHHESMERDVAIKVLKPEMKLADPELTVRFLNEVKVVSKLKHPNTVTIYDFGETANGMHYMVLEFIAGIDLDQLLEKRKRFSVEYTAHLILQILSALQEAHHHKIIHRDLKPSNIMIGREGAQKHIVKVLDFGVAKFIDSRKATGRSQRRSTQFIGTPVYMSPEQVLGQRVSASSDLYSVGLILYELLTGDVPITAENLAAVARIHIDEAPIPFKRIDALPKPLAKIIRKATRRFPDERFTSAAAFSDALRAATEPNTANRKLRDEVSESTRAFFLERDSDMVPLIATGNDDVVTQKAKRVKRPTVPAPRPEKKANKKDVLELDFRKARQVDRARKNTRAPAPVQHKTVNYPIVFLGIGSLLLASYLAGALLPSESVGLRLLATTVPLFTAVLATVFAPHARRASGSWMEKWFEPILQKSIPLLGAILVLSFVLFPESAASSMRDNAAWFLPEGIQNSVLATAINSVGSIFATLYSSVSRILPW